MTHFNFIPVNARLVPKSRVPRDAAHPPALNMSQRPGRRSAPAPHLFGGHSWALLALAVVQSPSGQSALRWRLCWARLSVQRVSSLLFLLASSLTICSGVSSCFTTSTQTNKKKDFVGKVLSIHSAERLLDIDYPALYIQYTLTHFCLAQQTTNHVSQHTLQGKRGITLIWSITGDGRKVAKRFYSIQNF